MYCDLCITFFTEEDHQINILGLSGVAFNLEKLMTSGLVVLRQIIALNNIVPSFLHVHVT